MFFLFFKLFFLVQFLTTEIVKKKGKIFMLRLLEVQKHCSSDGRAAEDPVSNPAVSRSKET